ncbi:hypothetical protein AMK59_2020 [Oryctes borbonicus]|uniref:Uncharacterized protein n=1 Tax=Oryctes borbonicus TaxID=1629725 RepID=A0A0T6BD84_9SCAR|nr:hypothetical protein AMK59_2020 [Oryctes borbonicus]
MSRKSKTQSKSVPRMRTEEKCLLQEAAERYADTSWRIHHDWYKKMSVPSGVIKNQQYVQKSTNNNIETTSNVYVEAIRNGTANVEIVPTTPKQLRKVIEIQTVQTTCEKVPSSAISQTKQQSDNSRNAIIGATSDPNIFKTRARSGSLPSSSGEVEHNQQNLGTLP